MMNIRKLQQEIKHQTSHIRRDRRPTLELAKREHLQALYLRLIPLVYAYSGIEPNQFVQAVVPKLNALENQYLIDRLSQVRKKRHVSVLSRGEDDILLPLKPEETDDLPLAVVWTDGGFYTAKERNHSNSAKLRKLGLPDGIAGYASYRLSLINPPLGRSAKTVGPLEITVTSSYEAEAMAVELALSELIALLESERNLPNLAQFHIALFSDCQSLMEALRSSEPQTVSPTVSRIQNLTNLFAAIYPQWEARHRIKQRFGH